MVHCCIIGCKSRSERKQGNITFHKFPNEAHIRHMWIISTGRQDWEPTNHSKICSRHFESRCFRKSQRMTYLYEFSVPTLYICNNPPKIDIPSTSVGILSTAAGTKKSTSHNNTEDNTEEMAAAYVCRMCLCTNRKVFNIGENNIAQQYEFLTASKDCVGDVLPQYICWECKARLASFARLRSVAMRSLELLQMLDETVNRKETTEDVQIIIDRDTNKLSSTLTQSNIQIADYPPNGGVLVVFDVKPDNSVGSYFENENDNDKSTNISKVLSIKSTKVQNENYNDNSDSDVNDDFENRLKMSRVLNDGNINTIVVNKTDNSSLNYVNYHLKNGTTVSQAKCNVNENDDSDDDYNNDNFEDIGNDTFDTNIENETVCQKTDTIDYNSGLEDMIYDSDSSGSENDNIKRKVDSDIAKVLNLFDENKLDLITQGVNTDRTNIAIYNNPSIDKDIKETFDIKVLSKDEQLKEFLNRKESKNYKNAGFKCDICYKGFIFKNAFNLHKITHTDVNGPLTCSLCGVHHKSARSLKCHIKQSHQNRYYCKKCDYVTGAMHNAKLHVDYHKGCIYECPQCDRTFQKKTSWFSHIRIHHPSDIVCRLCGHSFVSEKGLYNHTALTHKLETLEVPEDGPRCIECNIQFSTDAALTTHYQESNKHKHLLPEKQRRKRGTPNDTKRVYAIPRYEKQGAVICEVCNIELPNHRKYRYHFEQNHPGQTRTKFPGTFMCDMCGLFLSCRSVLEQHKETEHADVKKTYSCQECEKKFKTKHQLNLHKEIHLIERKRYACDICDNTFSSYANMLRHKIIHENRKFDCNICGKSFSHPQNRQSHITYVHNKKPLPVRRNRVRVKKGRKDFAESLESTELIEEEIIYD